MASGRPRLRAGEAAERQRRSGLGAAGCGPDGSLAVVFPGAMACDVDSTGSRRSQARSLAASGTLLQGCDQNGWDRLHFLTKQRYLPLIPLSDTSAIDLHLHLLGPFHFPFGSWGSCADQSASVVESQ